MKHCHGNLRRSDLDHLNLFQCEKQHSVNINHLLKSTYALKNGTGAMTTEKNEVFIGLQHENSYIVGGINLCWG